MPEQDPTYRTNVYAALKGELGDSFTKTEDEFNAALDNEKGYDQKVYAALKGELGESFSKTEDEFYSLVKKKDEPFEASLGASSQKPSPSPSIAEGQSGFRTSFEKGQVTKKDYVEPETLEFDEPPEIKPGTFDYIMEQGGANSLSAKGIMFLSLTDQAVKYHKENPLKYAAQEMQKLKSQREDRFADYDPAIPESIASGLISLFLDAGPFKIASEGATAALKAAKITKGWLIKSGAGAGAKAVDTAVKGGLKKVIESGIHTGLVLGQYSAAQNMLEQIESKGDISIEDWSWQETLKTFGKDFLIGVPVGGVGAIGGIVGSKIESKLIDKGVSNFMSKASGGALEYGGFTPVEAGVFELGGAYIPDPETGETRTPTLGGIASSFGVVLGAKIGGKTSRGRVSENFLTEKAGKGEFEIDLSVDELNRLSGDTKIGMTKDQIIDKMIDNDYKQFVLDNPDIAWSTKSKLLWATEGIEISDPPDVVGYDVKTSPDGRSVLEAKDIDGAVVQRIGFSDKMGAMQAAASVDSAIKESNAIKTIDDIGVEGFASVDASLRQAGIEGGLDSNDLSVALSIPQKWRTSEQQKTVNTFMKAVNDYKPPETPAEATNQDETRRSPESNGEVPLKEESAEKQLKTASEKPSIKKEGDKWVLTIEGERKEFKSQAAAQDALMIAEKEKSGEFDVMTEGMITPEEKKAKIAESRPMAASIEESFSISEKPENLKRSMIEPPPEKEAAEGEVPKPKTEIELLTERVKARRIAQEAIDATSKNRIGQVLLEHFVDVNEPFKRALIKEGVGAAKQFVNRMNLEAGASAYAKEQLQEAQERVFGKGLNTMSKKQQEFLSEIADLVRTVELDDLMESRRQELIPKRIEEEETRIGRKLKKEERKNLEENVKEVVQAENPDLMHEGEVDGARAKVLLEKFRNKDPEILSLYGVRDYDPERIEASIKEYHNVMREQLSQLYEEGIINKAVYDKLRTEQPYYSPRKYISHWEGIDSKGSLSGIKPLEGGSIGEKIVDMNTLMGDVISRTSNLIARNKKMQAGAAYATEINSNLVQNAGYTKAFADKLAAKKEGDPFIPPQFKETPHNMKEVDYYDKGQLKRLWIDKRLYQYFDYAKPDQATEMSLYALSMVTGTPILKFFATGANPEFAVKNLLIDALHVWMTTPEYSSFMPLGIKQLLSDYASVAHDARTKTGQWKDYVKEGGGMSFLTTQGTETPFKFGRYTKKTSTLGQVRDAMAGIGEFSEAWTRLALRKRYIDNRISAAEKEGITLSPKEMKDIQEAGTAAARNYLDFSQGGKTAKVIDKFIPYFGAGIQVTRGSIRAAGKNPVMFSAKLAQISALTIGLTAWNMGDHGDKKLAEERRRSYLNDISPAVKARNFIIMTNMSYTDKSGNKRYLYFKVPKDGLQSSITSLTEDVYIKAVHDGTYKLMNDKLMASLNNEMRNITDFQNLPPIYRAMQGYKRNYDSFYETEIWSGREQPPKDASQEYYDGATPPRYVKFGDITGMSPVRTQYFAKQFFTEGNIFASIIGEFMDGLVLGFEGEAKDVMEKEGYEKLKGVPALRRILKSTYPQPPEIAEEAELELNKVKTENDHRLNQLLGGVKSLEEVDDVALNILLEETATRDGQYEAERMIDKIMQRMKEEGVGSAVRKLKWFSPEVRALGFYYLIQNSPDKEGEYWEQAKAAGISSERFKQEVGRLMDMSGVEEPNEQTEK